MKEFWNKYKMWIIGISIILIIIAIIYFWGKSAGKKYQPQDIVIPPDLQQPGSPSVYNPGPITDAIYEDLDEVFGYHESDPYAAALKLSNSQLAAVYNDWNRRYAKDFDNKTIIQAIKDESSLFNHTWAITAGNLIKRFESLPGTQGRSFNY